MRGPNINTPPSTNRIDLAQSAHRVKSLQSYARRLLRCMSPELALFGHGAMSDLSPLSGVKRKLDFGAVRAAFDLGCVKTCTSRECAELFSLFSSFDGDCQSGSFLIQRNRDKLSTRKPDVGVFTQPGSIATKLGCRHDVRFPPVSDQIADIA